MECLKPTELKLVFRGNEFQAFTTRSLKKIDRAQVLLRLLNNLKLCPRVCLTRLISKKSLTGMSTVSPCIFQLKLCQYIYEAVEEKNKNTQF